jgi:RND family efflux transporter MFP subunit
MKIMVLLILSVLLFACQKEESKTPELTIKSRDSQFSIVVQGELDAVNSTAIVATAKTTKPQVIAWIVPQHSHVDKGDLIARFDGIPFQLEVDEAEYEMNKLMFTRAQKQRELNLSLDDFNNEEDVVSFEFLMAQKFNIDNPMLYTKVEIIEASDNEEFLKAKSQHLETMAGFQQDKAQSEVGLIDSQSQLQISKVELNKTNLNQLEVLAPHAGVVVLKEGWDGSLPQAGKSVFPGTKIASLPDLSEMKALLYVPEIEAVGIKKNQKVDIMLHAFPKTHYTGTITQISKSAQPKKRDNPVKYFVVTVILNEKDELRLLPGQRLDATIYTSEKSNSVVVPIQTIFRKGKENWVYLKKNSEFVKKNITTGVCSSSQCIIKSGLKENDVIALIKPEMAMEDGS